VFAINIKKLAKSNEYEINGDVAYIELMKKDSTTIKATIDAENLENVLAKGTWFAQWSKDFNNYLVQTLCEVYKGDEKRVEKITLQSFLMNLHTKSPIIFKNGDTLDNRICNLELYKQNATNDFKELDAETVAIILRDKFGKENGKAIIDKDDFERVLSTGLHWDCQMVNSKPFAVANTPEGRIFLNKFIMQTPENDFLKAINLNTLDTRKSNIRHIVSPKDTEDGVVKRYRK